MPHHRFRAPSHPLPPTPPHPRGRLISRRRIALLLALVPLLAQRAAAQLQTPPDLLDLPPSSGPVASLPFALRYGLGAGDKVKVIVFGQNDLTQELEIDSEGRVNMPLLGPVPAAGLTTTQLAERLRQLLDRDFLVKPRVTVDVAAYRPFYILGEVNKPGNYPFTVGLTVRRAIAVAGGYTRRANISSFTVIRVQQGRQTEIDLALDDEILPGDSVTVLRRWL